MPCHKRTSAIGLLVAVLAALTSLPAVAQRAGGGVSLPYTFADSGGNNYLIYQMGQFQQQGNTPVYGQGAILQINNRTPQNRRNQARIDDKSGELILEDLQIQGLSVTRRISFNKEEGWLRYVDIFRNASQQPITPSIMYSVNVNYGLMSSSVLDDPKHKGVNLAWIAQTQANGLTCLEMFAGKGAKDAPSIHNNPNDSNTAVFNWSPSIPAGREIALLHFHKLSATPDTASRWVLELKENKALAGIAPAIRRLIVNFRSGDAFIGDYEILRGELLDVVELRGGDQLRGTLKESTFKLQTFYGPVELKVDQVVGLINVGQFRPRQLLVTQDGQVFGGELGQTKITLELSSGQITEIPITQITRMGYRKRTGEPDEWTFDKPLVLLRTGERISVAPPAAPVEVATRYGPLKLAASVVSALDFDSEDHGVHEIHLTDGSRFAGLVATQTFDMSLAGPGGKPVKFPTSSIRRLQLTLAPDAGRDPAPSLSLVNQDMLVGSLQGQLKLDTAFSTLVLNGPEIKRMTKAEGSPADVQVVMWDDTTVTGQLQEMELTVKLDCGIQLSAPVALLAQYTQPRPHPPAAVVQSIKQLVTQLNAVDWKQRDAAQQKLIQIGVVTLSTLKELRPTQPPEAQQRIDQIIKEVEAALSTQGGGGGGGDEPDLPPPADGMGMGMGGMGMNAPPPIMPMLDMGKD